MHSRAARSGAHRHHVVKVLVAHRVAVHAHQHVVRLHAACSSRAGLYRRNKHTAAERLQLQSEGQSRQRYGDNGKQLRAVGSCRRSKRPCAVRAVANSHACAWRRSSRDPLWCGKHVVLVTGNLAVLEELAHLPLPLRGAFATQRHERFWSLERSLGQLGLLHCHKRQDAE